jgi:phosphate:Na+ symporter
VSSESAFDGAAAFLAGLVFFFIGLDGIRSSLKGLASREMRRRAQRATASPLRAALLGIGFGAIAQSATAVAFVLGGLVSTRFLTLRRALTVVAFANPGTALLAFLAAINLNVATLWLIGLAGLAMRQRRLAHHNAALGALLGIGFLLFGLVELKLAAAPLGKAAWFEAITAVLNSSLLLAFIVGTALRLVIQSSSAIAVILIALCGKGLIEPTQAMMVIHGTGIGIGLSVLMLGHGLRGDARRISYWQAILNSLSIIELLSHASLTIETVLATGFFVQMSMGAVFNALLSANAPRILSRLVPDHAEEELAKPAFISENNSDSPELAVELVQREQVRILRAAPALLDRARLDRTHSTSGSSAALHTSLVALHTEIASFLAECTEHAHAHEAGTLLVHAIGREQVVGELIDAIDALGTEVSAMSDGTSASTLCGGLVEATDAMLHVLADALEGTDEMDREILAAMTSDRSEQLESVRRSAASTHFGTPREQAATLYAISLFERVVYLARRLSPEAAV